MTQKLPLYWKRVLKNSDKLVLESLLLVIISLLTFFLQYILVVTGSPVEVCNHHQSFLNGHCVVLDTVKETMNLSFTTKPAIIDDVGEHRLRHK